jgi:hypothetical protein
MVRTITLPELWYRTRCWYCMHHYTVGFNEGKYCEKWGLSQRSWKWLGNAWWYITKPRDVLKNGVRKKAYQGPGGVWPLTLRRNNSRMKFDTEETNWGKWEQDNLTKINASHLKAMDKVLLSKLSITNTWKKACKLIRETSRVWPESSLRWTK